MRNYNRRNNQVNRTRRELKREGMTTLRSGLGLVPKLGTAIGIYDTANGIVRTTRAAARYGDALKQQTTARVRTKIKTVTRPARKGLNSINRFVS
jgi:hypothetical protein